MAIAFDAFGSAQSSSSGSLTFSHTCSGNWIIVFIANSSSTTTASVTYQGQALYNLEDLVTLGGSAGTLDMWALYVPPTGTGNVVVTFSGTATNPIAISVSYANVNIAILSVEGVPGEDGPTASFDGGDSGNSTAVATTFSGNTAFLNDVAPFAVVTAATGTAITGGGISTKRVGDITQGTLRMATFDLLIPTLASANWSATVGSGQWATIGIILISRVRSPLPTFLPGIPSS